MNWRCVESLMVPEKVSFTKEVYMYHNIYMLMFRYSCHQSNSNIHNPSTLYNNPVYGCTQSQTT